MDKYNSYGGGPQYYQDRSYMPHVDKYRNRDYERKNSEDRDRHRKRHRSDKYRGDRDRDYDRHRKHKKRKRSHSSRRRSDSRDSRHHKKKKRKHRRRSNSDDSVERYYTRLIAKINSNPPSKIHASQDPSTQPKYQTPQEKLEEYKKMYPSVNTTIHNKTDRQLYVGNLPPEITIPELCKHLNDAMYALNLCEKEDRPVVDAWISSDGHYAFVEFRTIKDAHLGFALTQIAIHGHALKIGKPKIANSSYAALAQQMNSQSKYDEAIKINQQPQTGYVNPTAMAASSVAMNNQFDNVLKSLPGPPTSSDMVSNPSAIKSKTKTITKLLVSNLPVKYQESQIRDILGIVGAIKELEILKDVNSGKFKGEVYVQFEREEDSRKAEAALMGMSIGDAFLYVKKVQSTTILQEDDHNLMPRQVQSGPSCCLMLTNLLIPEQVEDINEYADVEDETFEEMEQYGKVEQVIAPKPTMKYAPGQPPEPGVGKVFVKFATINEAEVGRKALEGRRFEGRIVEASYYPEDKFRNGQFE